MLRLFNPLVLVWKISWTNCSFFSEPMFNDSTGVVAVREHMRSLDWYQRVHYKVVNAYARRCTYCWQLTGNKWRTTFDVVIKVRRQVFSWFNSDHPVLSHDNRHKFPLSYKQGETELNRKGMVDHWLSWILRCQIDIYKAQLVITQILNGQFMLTTLVSYN